MRDIDRYGCVVFIETDLATDADGKAKIEFYNNATCRKMAVDAQGITADGVISTSVVK